VWLLEEIEVSGGKERIEDQGKLGLMKTDKDHGNSDPYLNRENMNKAKMVIYGPF